MMVLLQYSLTEPYISDGQLYILAYDPYVSKGWEKYTFKDVADDKKAEAAWNKICSQILWNLPGNLNFPAEIPKPEELQEIFNCLVHYIAYRVWFRDDRAPFVLANWIILSYFRDKFDFIPLLIIDGASASGKSALGKLLASVCYRGRCFANFTPAATVRLVHKHHMSVFLDETLDVLDKKDVGKDILNILKCMTSTDQPYIRAVPNTSDDVNIYNIKTSAAISIKGREIPEDLVNRGIRIQMLTKPSDAKLERLKIDEDEPIDGSYSLREIRAKLTALKISMELNDEDLAITHTDWSNLISEQIEKSYEMLTTNTSEGWLYGLALGLQNAPNISDRYLDIANTMLSIAMLTDSERDTMEFILNNNVEIKESDHNSFEGEVLRGFVDVLQDHIDNAPFEILSRNMPTNIIRKITTREIAQQVNSNMHANVDLNRWDDIGTRKVTHTLKTLGITYTYGAGGHNQSTIDPTTPGFFEHLEALIKRYDPGSDVLKKLKEMDARRNK